MRSENQMTEIINYKPTGFINAANIERFQDELRRAINDKKVTTILVNMKGVEFLDSNGLISLLQAYKAAQSRKQRFSICSLSPSVRIIFELSQLDQVFEIFENQSAFEESLNNYLAA